jgi:hypothetical protein
VACGSFENLEIDHIDPGDKEHSIGSVWSWSKERREAELKKCQVLCRSCHRAKTRRDFGWSLHGSYGYKRGCRCSQCRGAHAKHNRDYNRRKRQSRAATLNREREEALS